MHMRLAVVVLLAGASSALVAPPPARAAALRMSGAASAGTATALPPPLAKLVAALAGLPDDKYRYKQLLHWAAEAPSLSEEARIDANKVPGCLSTVHVTAELRDDGAAPRGSVALRAPRRSVRTDAPSKRAAASSKRARPPRQKERGRFVKKSAAASSKDASSKRASRRRRGSGTRGATMQKRAAATAGETVEIRGDSDAQLTKGLVVLLAKGLTGATPAEVSLVDASFIRKAGVRAAGRKCLRKCTVFVAGRGAAAGARRGNSERATERAERTKINRRSRRRARWTVWAHGLREAGSRHRRGGATWIFRGANEGRRPPTIDRKRSLDETRPRSSRGRVAAAPRGCDVGVSRRSVGRRSRRL